MTLRANNFDLLRLVFAGAVFFWHASVLTGAPALRMLGELFSSDVAVKGFFVISGYLVTMSHENSASLRDYAQKRARRIYPAYAAVVIACALAGVLFSALPAAEYFSAGFARYLAANLVFLNFLAPRLPGVFEGQVYDEVNGALWTLKIEVMYYALVPVIAVLAARLGRWRVLGALYVLAAAYYVILGELHARSGLLLWAQLQRQLPGLLGYFLVGAGFYFLRDRLEGRWRALVAAAVAMYGVVLATRDPVLMITLEPLALGTLVVWAGVRLPYLGNFARFGDLSYGLYIVHFPVIQGLIALGLFAATPWGGFGAALGLVALIALASWHLVEKPFLARRSHYRQAEQAEISSGKGT